LGATPSSARGHVHDRARFLHRDLALFRERAFSAGLLAQLVFWSGQASFFLVLALYAQEGRGMGPLKAGLVFTVLAASYLAASMRAPALAVKHGRRVLTAAALTLAAGHAVLLAGVAIIGVHGSVAVLAPRLLLIGAGMGLGIAPLATIIMSAMRPEQAGAASGALATFQNVGNAIGVAVIGVVFYGALHAGFAVALERSEALLAAVLLLVPAPSEPASPGAEVMFGLKLAAPGDGRQLSFFSTITTFGTPLDITVSEIAIEAFFPADDVTAQVLAELAATI
jgi:MFS family permease